MEEPKHIQQAIEHTKILFGEELGLVSEEDVLNWLKAKVRHMLEHDFNRLVNLLYRIDVYEEKARHCFGRQNLEIADCLAKLIWERQLQKVRRS